MNYLMILLRLIHVVAAIFWVGGILFFNLLVSPAAAATAESGQKFMQALMTKSRMSTRIASAGGSAILAGFILYWLDSDGFTSRWTTSGPGIGFGIGAIFGLIGFTVGIMMARLAHRQGTIAGSMQGGPTSQQAAELADLQARMARLAPINTVALALAAVFMATARYFSF
jgi:uncharacterized membrane protein